jgi:hypothetical protein
VWLRAGACVSEGVRVRVHVSVQVVWDSVMMLRKDKKMRDEILKGFSSQPLWVHIRELKVNLLMMMIMMIMMEMIIVMMRISLFG